MSASIQQINEHFVNLNTNTLSFSVTENYVIIRMPANTCAPAGERAYITVRTLDDVRSAYRGIRHVAKTGMEPRYVPGYVRTHVERGPHWDGEYGVTIPGPM